MYFPIGWPKELSCGQGFCQLTCLSANREKLFFAVLSTSAIAIWYGKPAVQIVSFQRSANSVDRFGVNLFVEWKADSSMIIVITSNGYLLFYKVLIESSGSSNTLYSQKDPRQAGRQNSLDADLCSKVPALALEQNAYIQIQGGISCIDCLKDDILVATQSGLLHRLQWDGIINNSLEIQISAIPFSVDLQHSRASVISEVGVYAEHVAYSPLLMGFAIVLSNGKAGFITARTTKFEPRETVGIWAQEVTYASCVSVNHRYLSMVYGCTNGEALSYCFDEMTGALTLSHKMAVSSKELPDAGQVCGAVSQMKWTSDGCAIALTWEAGGFSLWSSFGALLLCSLYPDGSSICNQVTPSMHITSMVWGSEGYHLWVIDEKKYEEGSVNGSEEGEKFEMVPTARSSLLQIQLVKSALAANPCSSNHAHLFLQSEDKLYISSDEAVPNWPQQQSGLSGVGSKQWTVVPIPQSYLAYNWPIRYAAVSKSGHSVAIAGRMGLAHYALASRKWKLFGNESQERDVVVTGGLTWWKDFVCAACYSLVDGREEIRFYPQDAKLDNTFCHIVRVPSPIVLLNTFHNQLIVFCADSHIMIFRLEKDPQQKNVLIVSKMQEVAVGSFVAHPATALAITLTSVRTDVSSGRNISLQPSEGESLILNLAGRLLMFQRDHSGPQPKVSDGGRQKPLPFCAPVVVASSVENMWTYSHPTEKKPHLTEALWLCCGATGVKVWLPLHPKEDLGGKTRGFMSRRIMLPFSVDIYPLAILFEGGILLGTCSDPIFSSHVKRPYLQLQRTNQIYLHHILRLLLRRNLGVYALEIARSCVDLPYFPHVLELLVHEVLEEEATSKEPIPDPLLPRVVAFVQEFPQFLQTIVHCARKTEVALWQYLFSTVGNPKDLFEECLVNDQLETASSYLIILQSLEKPMLARQHATLLLDAALSKCNWQLTRDLVRFLKAISPADVESPHGALLSKPIFSSSSGYPTPAPHISPANDSESFVFPLHVRGSVSDDIGRSRHESSGERHNRVQDIWDKRNEKTKARSNTLDGAVKHSEETVEEFFIDSILKRHARKLLSSYRLFDLASFSANLDDYKLVTWLRSERLRAARVENFVDALKTLHKDFNWPWPIESKMSLKILSATQLQSHARGHSNGNGSISTSGSSETSCTEALSEQSLSSSPAAESSDLNVSELTSWSENFNPMELQQLSNELANQGPPKQQHQLRFLHQIMLDAGCLEWALLIGTILRDALIIVCVVNTASMAEIPLEIIGRMQEGISALQLWAHTECFGYKAFLLSIDSQMQALQRLVKQDPPVSRLSLSRTRSLASSEPDGLDASCDSFESSAVSFQEKSDTNGMAIAAANESCALM